jgi:hypothetical protein
MLTTFSGTVGGQLRQVLLYIENQEVARNVQCEAVLLVEGANNEVKNCRPSANKTGHICGNEVGLE